MPYSQDVLNRPPKVKLICEDESRARQSEKERCDVNKIMAKYQRTGVIPMDMRQAAFADVSQVSDYRTALDNVRRAKEFFMTLPPKVRQRFMNDPAEFLDFVGNPENRGELEELGLVERSIAPEGGTVEKPTETPPE